MNPYVRFIQLSVSGKKGVIDRHSKGFNPGLEDRMD
jgi:hypothetical protein